MLLNYDPRILGNGRLPTYVEGVKPPPKPLPPLPKGKPGVWRENLNAECIDENVKDIEAIANVKGNRNNELFRLGVRCYELVEAAERYRDVDLDAIIEHHAVRLGQQPQKMLHQCRQGLNNPQVIGGGRRVG